MLISDPSMNRLFAILLAAAAALCGGVALGASFGVGHQVANAGDWQASFTFVKTGSLDYSNLHLTVVNGSRLVLDQPVTSSLPGVGKQLQPVFYVRALSFRDLNGDGSKELLISLFTGGAHCCSIEQVFDFSGATPRKTEFDFADAGATVKVLGGKVVFRTTDDSFAYQFTDYADSGAPVQIWAYNRGRFTDVTRDYKPEIAKDAAFWWKAYRVELPKHGDVRRILSAWAADEALLGNAATAKQTLLQIAFNGALDNGFGSPKGSTYVRSLWRFLTKEGYLG